MVLLWHHNLNFYPDMQNTMDQLYQNVFLVMAVKIG